MGAKGAIGTGGGLGARAGRVLLAMSASTFLTAVVALPIAYQAHAAREAPATVARTTEGPVSVLGSSTVPTTTGTIDPTTPTTDTTPAPETTVAAVTGSDGPATTVPRSPRSPGRRATATTAPRFVAPAPPAGPTTLAPATTSPPVPTTAPPTTTTPRLSPQGLYFSTSVQLQPASALDGSQIGEVVYVFVDLPDISQVAFELDGTASATEFRVPFELFGGEPLVPSKLAPGPHTVRADITFLDGRIESRAAVFTTITAR